MIFFYDFGGYDTLPPGLVMIGALRRYFNCMISSRLAHCILYFVDGSLTSVSSLTSSFGKRF